MYDPKFMKEAVMLASKWKETGEGGPFGAVVVRNGRIIGRGVNQVTVLNDPTAHAEIMAIREACQHLNTFQIYECELYSSCEPCPMCLGAIYWARPKIVYFSASREDAAFAGFDDSFIYEEIGLHPLKRKIVSEQHITPEAFAIFREWRNWGDKKSY